MKKLSDFIVKYRWFILGFFVVVLALSTVGAFFLNVNSDIMSYLPEDMETGKGMDFMRENFDMQGDAMIAVNRFSFDEAKSFAVEIAKEEGVKEGGVIWIGAFDDFAGLGGLGAFGGVIEEIKNNPDIVKMFRPKDDCYMFMLQFDVPTGSSEAMNVLGRAEELLDGREFAIGGSSYIVKQLFDTVLSEMVWYMAAGVAVVTIILLLATKSYLEPLILLLTLGISIVVNLGSNALLPEISIITFAASSILQLGLSMDYAIFLMHAYHRERERTLDPKAAMRGAIPSTLNTITASALTTIGGFLALFFMKFRLGADLGLVLAKGVLLSLVTVILLQPCLILISDKGIKKTTHRQYELRFNGLAGFSVKRRVIISAVALLLLAPAMIGQFKVQYSYMKLQETNPLPTEAETIIEKMGNTLVVMTPEASPEQHYAFIEKAQKIEGVEAVNGLYAMIPQEYGRLLPQLMQKEEIRKALSGYVNNGYTLYSFLINVDEESPEGARILSDIRSAAQLDFGTERHIYITGQTQAVQDLSSITPGDFMAVSLISIAIIFLILLLSTRSFKLPLILIAVIELGIFLNLSICYVSGQRINFMAYIILSSIQLGATVDYAILYCGKFKKFNETTGAKQSAYLALCDCGTSVLTSAAIIAGACLSVSLITKNLIIGQMTMLIARGAAISCILVMVLLPALMSLFGGKKRDNLYDRFSAEIKRKRAEKKMSIEKTKETE